MPGTAWAGDDGWLKRLSDLLVFPSQARIYSKLISLYPLNHLQKSSPPFPQTKKNLSFQTGFLNMVGERGFEPPTHWSQTSCATKLRYSPMGAHVTATPEQRQPLFELLPPIAWKARG